MIRHLQQDRALERFVHFGAAGAGGLVVDTVAPAGLVDGLRFHVLADQLVRRRPATSGA